MSKKYNIIVEKNNEKYLCRVPYKCLSMKQRQHLHYFPGILKKDHINRINKTENYENRIDYNN